MRSAWIGLACLLVFAVAQAARDAFFGSVFQSVSFLVVAVLAFGGSTIVFGAWAWWRQPDEVQALISNTKPFLALNATTCIAWMGYFFALKHLEPAIVSTLYTGIGPIAVLTLASLGVSAAKGGVTGWVERLAYAGILASLIAIAAVALSEQSGLTRPPLSLRTAAVLVATMGGVIITISHLVARHLGDLGIGSNALMGLRFPLTLALAAVAELVVGEPEMRPDIGSVPLLAAAAFGLIVIPSYFLQLGVARTSPLAVNVMRSLGPIFVFAVQQLDGRLSFSGATLYCVLAYVFFGSIASTLRSLEEARQP